MHLQLAIEYEVHGFMKEALSEYQQIILKSNNIPENDLSTFELGRCYAGLGNIISNDNKKLGKDIFELGIAACPLYSDNYFLAAQYYYNEQQF